MGVRLKVGVIFFVLFCFCSCKTSKKKVKDEEYSYVQAYKTSVLYGCLNEATNGNFQKFSIENNDLGLAQESEIIGKIEVTEITNIGGKLSKKIRVIDYSDYEGRKPIFSDCVGFAFSKEIDSVARKKFKEFKKAKLRYEYE